MTQKNKAHKQIILNLEMFGCIIKEIKEFFKIDILEQTLVLPTILCERSAKKLLSRLKRNLSNSQIKNISMLRNHLYSKAHSRLPVSIQERISSYDHYIRVLSSQIRWCQAHSVSGQ
jgi:hypothetical protein